MKMTGAAERAWADNIHARCTEEAILLTTKLHLANKTIELLKDKVDRDSLTMYDFQSKLSLSKAKTHATKEKLRWLEKKVA